MTNSDNGWSLQQELLRTIAQVYAWPELPPRETLAATEDAATSSTAVGEYELYPGLSLTISRHGEHLFFQMPGQLPLKLIRQSDALYMLAHMDDTITFVRDGRGNVTALILQQGATKMVALRRGAVG